MPPGVRAARLKQPRTPSLLSPGDLLRASTSRDAFGAILSFSIMVLLITILSSVRTLMSLDNLDGAVMKKLLLGFGESKSSQDNEALAHWVKGHPEARTPFTTLLMPDRRAAAALREGCAAPRELHACWTFDRTRRGSHPSGVFAVL